MAANVSTCKLWYSNMLESTEGWKFWCRQAVNGEKFAKQPVIMCRMNGQLNVDCH